MLFLINFKFYVNPVSHGQICIRDSSNSNVWNETHKFKSYLWSHILKLWLLRLNLGSFQSKLKLNTTRLAMFQIKLNVKPNTLPLDHSWCGLLNLFPNLRKIQWDDWLELLYGYKGLFGSNPWDWNFLRCSPQFYFL